MAAVDVATLVDTLDSALQPGAFEDGQHNGLQVQGTGDVAHLATAVSCNQATMEAALAAGADALLTHHGLLWGGVDTVTGILHRRLKTAMDAGLHLLSYHLPMDAHPTLGNNAALAEAAGVPPGEWSPAFFHGGAPIGLVGTLPETTLFEPWMEALEQTLRAGCSVATGPFQVWPFGPDEVARIGFVSGAGAYDVASAIDLGLDCFVTGEPRESVYHLCKEAGIHFVAGGHYLTERLGTARVGDWVAGELGLKHTFVDVATEV